jgi:hypothetical protein
MSSVEHHAGRAGFTVVIYLSGTDGHELVLQQRFGWRHVRDLRFPPRCGARRLPQPRHRRHHLVAGVSALTPQAAYRHRPRPRGRP